MESRMESRTLALLTEKNSFIHFTLIECDDASTAQDELNKWHDESRVKNRRGSEPCLAESTRLFAQEGRKRAYEILARPLPGSAADASASGADAQKAEFIPPRMLLETPRQESPCLQPTASAPTASNVWQLPPTPQPGMIESNPKLSAIRSGLTVDTGRKGEWARQLDTQDESPTLGGAASPRKLTGSTIYLDAGSEASLTFTSTPPDTPKNNIDPFSEEEGPVAATKSKKARRPCKGQRDRFRKFVERTLADIDRDAQAFDFRQIDLPPSLEGDERRIRKLRQQLQAYQAEKLKALPM